MSFVSIVARSSWISVVSDGRVTAGDDVVEEQYQKFILPTSGSFIAYAGNKQPCELIAKRLLDTGFRTDPLEESARRVFGMIAHLKDLGHKAFVALGEVSASGAEFYACGPNQSVPVFFRPKGDDVCYSFLSNTHLSDEALEQQFVLGLQRSGVDTSAQCQQAQIELNEWVADRDVTVNKNTFCALLPLFHEIR